MNGFYQDLITEKSWELLKSLVKSMDFTLIGGWAVYLYTQTLKSKDIDIIVDLSDLEYLKKQFILVKNERLKKYEVKKDGVDIDIYIPYYSNPGIKAEEIIKYKNRKEGFSVPQKEVLLLTKQKAYQERQTSSKGQKDKIDIISLLMLADFDFKLYGVLFKRYNLSAYDQMIKDILAETKEVPELGLNRHFFAKKKREILTKLLF